MIGFPPTQSGKGVQAVSDAGGAAIDLVNANF
jgi:hypothetical protein